MGKKKVKKPTTLDEAVWLTLYVYGDWISSWKVSHLVSAQLGLHSEVTGVNLA